MHEFIIKATTGTEIPVETFFSAFLVLVDPCPKVRLFNTGESPFKDVLYTLSKPAERQAFQVSSLVGVNTNVIDCGPIGFEFTDDQGNPLDDIIFSVNTDKYDVPN